MMPNSCSIYAQMSLPTRGGWIEIQPPQRSSHRPLRPSPHGEGGLKYTFPSLQKIVILSPSPHGEGGLKSGDGGCRMKDLQSLPTRGGWIEMLPSTNRYSRRKRPSPHGEGGLKCRANKKPEPMIPVPPHTGRVD